MDIELVVRESRHRHGVGALLATGDCEVEQTASLVGIGPKEFVEVAHSKQHQRTGAPGLGCFKLLHHGCPHGGKM